MCGGCSPLMMRTTGCSWHSVTWITTRTTYAFRLILALPEFAQHRRKRTQHSMQHATQLPRSQSCSIAAVSQFKHKVWLTGSDNLYQSALRICDQSLVYTYCICFAFAFSSLSGQGGVNTSLSRVAFFVLFIIGRSPTLTRDHYFVNYTRSSSNP